MRSLAILLPLVIAACVEVDMPEPSEGHALFQDNCAICHGSGGTGDGELASELDAPPPDLTRLAVDNGGIFPRARVMSQIDGYTRMTSDGPDMPEFGLLLRGDLVPIDTGDGIMSPTPRPLAALMVYLESLQK